MCATGASRIPGDGVPLLRYLHMVRAGCPVKLGGLDFIRLSLGRKQAGYGSKLNLSSSKWWDLIRTTRYVMNGMEYSIVPDTFTDLVWYVHDQLAWIFSGSTVFVFSFG